MAGIALIDPDPKLAAALSAELRPSGHALDHHRDGAPALAAFAVRVPDLAVLALRGAGMNGLELLRRLRKLGAVPVIMTSPRRDETDEIVALKLGADDFLAQPSAAVLAVRIEALLRRCGARPTAASADPDFYGWIAYAPDGSCTVDGVPVDLTRFERAMVAAFTARPGAVLTRDRLSDVLYGENAGVDPRNVDSHIKRLRAKFEGACGASDTIETIYRAGYRLRARRAGNPPKTSLPDKDSQPSLLTPSGPS